MIGNSDIYLGSRDLGSRDGLEQWMDSVQSSDRFSISLLIGLPCCLSLLHFCNVGSRW